MERKWRTLTREQASQARDFSRAGETFIDYKDRLNEILYSILTPLEYDAFVSLQGLRHIERHPIAYQHKDDIPHILNNPDLVTLNPDNPKIHIFYKAAGKMLLAIPVHSKNELRFVATMYDTECVKGLKQGRILTSDFLYLRGGFKWKKWK